MKSIFISIALLVTLLSVRLSWVWPAVEFVLYLVKERPFNWFSLYFMLFTWVIGAVAIFAAAVLTDHKEQIRYKTRKSISFSERLKKLSNKKSGE